jgi:hypothetical protein
MRVWLASLLVSAGAFGCGGVSTDAFAPGAAADDASVDDGSVEGAVADDVAPDAAIDVLDAPLPPIDGGAADAARPDTKDTGPVCPTGSTSTPTKCPATCTGGCKGDVCTVNCQGIGSGCSNTTITCPLNMQCDVLCGGLNSCQNLRLFSAPTGALTLDCSGVNACTGVNVACPAQASCDVQCIGTGSCTNGQVACGAGACNAACSGLGVSLAKVNCGASCRCANTCTK